ncbi:hypothetical protein FIV34_17600 [Luteibacter pinisoli]|uniref:Acyl carrier protein n=1 Tax=Luteibacter pinisoli TaxID=2589080 RepID=A0A4Y5Z965_9GAMM|nr:hypothetical protein [Luteibacter pinisoli]QDE40895.1 hypothetical protein FIV34_17600 [Luteibacter pinisoli]
MATQKTLDKVRAVVASCLNVPIESVSEDARLTDWGDLGPAIIEDALSQAFGFNRPSDDADSDGSPMVVTIDDPFSQSGSLRDVADWIEGLQRG